MFADRRDAGALLAERLGAYRAAQPVVIALPRGGVPVAAVVAERLHAPLDVLVVRKIGCPWQPELGVGAIAEGGVRIMNEPLVASLELTPEGIDPIVARELDEIERRARRYRGADPPVGVAGRSVILVDDGLATGFTARAAIEILRKRDARRVVLAVPVGPTKTVRELGRVADEVVVLETPEWFFAIGEFYEDFRQTTDEEVIALLTDARARLPGRPGAGSPESPRTAPSEAGAAEKVASTDPGGQLPKLGIGAGRARTRRVAVRPGRPGRRWRRAGIWPGSRPTHPRPRSAPYLARLIAAEGCTCSHWW